MSRPKLDLLRERSQRSYRKFVQVRIRLTKREITLIDKKENRLSKRGSALVAHLAW